MQRDLSNERNEAPLAFGGAGPAHDDEEPDWKTRAGATTGVPAAGTPVVAPARVFQSGSSSSWAGPAPPKARGASFLSFERSLCMALTDQRPCRGAGGAPVLLARFAAAVSRG